MKNWQILYDEMISKYPLRGCRGITAYNEVVDKVYRLSDENISTMTDCDTQGGIQDILKTSSDFSGVLKNGLRKGVASEFHADDQLFERLESMFQYIPRIGGQAAIMGIILSRFAGQPVIIHPDRVDELLGYLLEGEDLLVPTVENEEIALLRPKDIKSNIRSERHLIFEFAEGQRTASGEICPRHNRLIIDPCSEIVFDRDFERALPIIARESDLFIAAGLNHMGSDFKQLFERVGEHAKTVKDANPEAIRHLEITGMTDKRKIESIAKNIIPFFDSIGVNESELMSVASAVDGISRNPDDTRSPIRQVEAIESLNRKGVNRVHMHTHGYYLRGGMAENIGSAIESMIYSACVVSAAAIKGDFPFPKDLKGLSLSPSRTGLEVLRNISEMLIHPYDASEIEVGAGNGIIAVPAPIVPDPKLTVGLGDCISSIALASEKMTGAF